MSQIKELKSIDLTSFTIIVTAITVLFSIISAILITLGIGIAYTENIGIIIYIVPTIVIGTLMYTIYNSFFGGLLYNILSKRLKNIQITLNNKKEILHISTTETAIMAAIILTVQAILIYLVSIFLVPFLINATIQTLMFSGQQAIAYSLYQVLLLLNQPIIPAVVIFGTFIITFVFVLLGTYIYNIIASRGKGINVNLSYENKMTVINSIDVLKFAIAFAIVNGVLTIILAIIAIISGGNIINSIGNILGGFVGGFIEATLIGVFYNILAPRIGKLKIELIDNKIN